MLLNQMENIGSGMMNSFQIAQKTRDNCICKVSTSADKAKHLGYLLNTDTIHINNDQRIWKAKQKLIEIIEGGYIKPKYRDDLKLPGAGGRTAMAMAVKGFKAQERFQLMMN